MCMHTESGCSTNMERDRFCVDTNCHKCSNYHSLKIRIICYDSHYGFTVTTFNMLVYLFVYSYLPGGHSISHILPFRKIFQSLQGARSVIKMFPKFLNLVGASAALLASRALNFKAMYGHFNTPSDNFESLRDLTIRCIMWYSGENFLDYWPFVRWSNEVIDRFVSKRASNVQSWCFRSC